MGMIRKPSSASALVVGLAAAVLSCSGSRPSDLGAIGGSNPFDGGAARLDASTEAPATESGVPSDSSASGHP